MDAAEQSQENTIPNIHVPENRNILAYLKGLHPFHEIILPFSVDKVNQDITPIDFIGRFSSMSSLPENSRYVIYGTEVLVHPDTGIIFGFISGTSLIYRLPGTLLKEVSDGNISNFRVMKDISGNGMEHLESNWVSSPSITEQLVHKIFGCYGEVLPEPEVVHLNFDLDLTTPRTREFQSKERWQRLLPLGIILAICTLSVLLLYAADYLKLL